MAIWRIARWFLLGILVIGIGIGLWSGGRATAPTAVTPTPTQTPEVAPPVAKAPVETPQQATWPTTPADAANLFGGTADRWELTPDGGWHLTEDHSRTVVNPAGFVGEGYYDTNPGRDPRQMVFTVGVEVQGCTIWPLSASEAQFLFDAMAAQKGYTTEQAMEYIDRVGW